jgi:hypothetical protein
MTATIATKDSDGVRPGDTVRPNGRQHVLFRNRNKASVSCFFIGLVGMTGLQERAIYQLLMKSEGHPWRHILGGVEA